MDHSAFYDGSWSIAQLPFFITTLGDPPSTLIHDCWSLHYLSCFGGGWASTKRFLVGRWGPPVGVPPVRARGPPNVFHGRALWSLLLGVVGGQTNEFRVRSENFVLVGGFLPPRFNYISSICKRRCVINNTKLKKGTFLQIYIMLTHSMSYSDPYDLK